MSAYGAAVREAARVYDPDELRRRNVAEGFAARRLAAEYAQQLLALHCEGRGWLHWLDEYDAADSARLELRALLERIGPREFKRVLTFFRDDALIEGLDY